MNLLAPAATAFIIAIVVGAPASSEPLSMEVGGFTTQPIGHYEFCKRLPAECGLILSLKGPEQMTPSMWKIVRDVNFRVNKQIKPRADAGERWEYPTEYGDCEDYALLKRRILIDEHGFSPANLLMTVVKKSDGEAHAILTLRTTKGDYFLDNLYDDVRLWFARKGYTYLKRQSTFHSGKWVSLRDDAKYGRATSSSK